MGKLNMSEKKVVHHLSANSIEMRARPEFVEKENGDVELVITTDIKCVPNRRDKQK